jgi:hypothetical protein
LQLRSTFSLKEKVAKRMAIFALRAKIPFSLLLSFCKKKVDLASTAI